MFRGMDRSNRNFRRCILNMAKVYRRSNCADIPWNVIMKPPFAMAAYHLGVKFINALEMSFYGVELIPARSVVRG